MKADSVTREKRHFRAEYNSASLRLNLSWVISAISVSLLYRLSHSSVSFIVLGQTFLTAESFEMVPPLVVLGAVGNITSEHNLRPSVCIGGYYLCCLLF